ncbi:MAG: hypothetical protein IKR85_06905 [Clostridia bacterium]|nr:hypothetical protein [Clostridia bacterium]
MRNDGTRAMQNITVEDFADILCLLEPVPETHEANVWYRTQKQHMIIWFQRQVITGHGAYLRQTANHSARTCYNRLLNSRSLLWIAYALGEDAETIQAASEATAKENDYRGKCRMFREMIPFDRICALLENPKGWKLDPALLPYLDYDDAGYPAIRQKPKKDRKAAEDVIFGELYPDEEL